MSVGYRTTGFGTPGTYSGVDSSVAVTWNDAAGQQIGSSPGISFPYHPVDWDLGDRLVRAPVGAAQLVLTAGLNNHSQQLLEDKRLLQLYPGSEGAIPAEVHPRRDTYPFKGLLIAGALYDYYRIVDAHHLTAYDMQLRMVPIRKGRSQVYVGFPETAQELFDHNVIYLCGADLTALTLRQKNMLAEYVRRGGGLILFGGHKALDRAGLQGSLLEVIGMTCFGPPGESQTPFWQWRSWVLLLRDLAWWVAGQDEHFEDGPVR